MEEISELSNGDISMALNQLYMVFLGNKQQQNNANVKKDSEIGLYHAIGKFLYNKRAQRQKNGKLLDNKQYTREEMQSLDNLEFYFDPYYIIQQTPCDKDVFRGFLQQNYLDFYGDIEDVANQADQFAQSDIFSKQSFKSEKDDRFKMENKQFNTFLSGLGVLVNNKGFTKDQLNTQNKTKNFKPLIRSSDIEVYKYNQQFKESFQQLQKDYPRQLSQVSRKTFIVDYYSSIKQIEPVFLKNKYKLDFQMQQNQNNNYQSQGQIQLNDKWKKGGNISEKDFKTEGVQLNENIDQLQNNEAEFNQSQLSQMSQNNNNNKLYNSKNIKSKVLVKEEEELEEDIEECE